MTNRQVYALGVLFLTVVASCATPTLDEGETAFAEERYVDTLRILTPFAEKGEPRALLLVGRLYANGLGVDEDLPAAIKYYEQAAEQGQLSSQLSLASIYFRDGDQETLADAVRWFEKASAKSIIAKYFLVDAYANGWGTTADPAKALSLARQVTHTEVHLSEEETAALTWLGWLTAAPDLPTTMQGRTDLLCGEILLEGIGIDKNEQEAAEWLKLATEHGNTTAKARLADLYIRGIGVPESKGEGVRLFREAAAEGDAWALRRVALLYADGDQEAGIEKDESEAFSLMRRSAEAGDSMSMWVVGDWYRRGQGVEESMSEAAVWYRKSADTGEKTGQMRLGLCYEKGDGVPQDYVEAHKWLNLAGARGEEYAREARDRIEKKLSPEQLAKAQQLASEWAPYAGEQ